MHLPHMFSMYQSNVGLVQEDY